VASPVHVGGHLTPGNQETRKSVINNPTASAVALNGFSVEIS
jgi:hypothetical protein